MKRILFIVIGGIAMFFVMRGAPSVHAVSKGSSCGASANISATAGEHFAWNDVIGWIDFLYSGSPNVSVTVSGITGCANTSAMGLIALDCATSPNGNICSTSSFKVSNGNDGLLAGWAWSDVIGWISFCGTTGPTGSGSVPQGQGWQCPSTTPDYQVWIDSAGDFHGWAWNDVIGWISVNCLNTNTCTGATGVAYKIKTSWTSITPPVSNNMLISSVFDTCPQDDFYCRSGGAIMSILWQGQPGGGGAEVRFQIASSRCPNGAPDPLPNPTIAGDLVCNNDDPLIDTQAEVDALNMWCEGNSCTQCSNSLTYQNDSRDTKSCFVGRTGTPSSNDYYTAAPDTPIPVFTGLGNINGLKRHVRYKAILKPGNNSAPRIDDIIIHWVR